MGTEKRERQKANRALRQQQELQAQSRRTLFRKVAIGVAALVAIIVVVYIASTLVGSDDDPVTPDGTNPTLDVTTVPSVDVSVPITAPTSGG